MAVLILAIRPTNLCTWFVTSLQLILTPLSVTVHVFAIFVPSCVFVLFLVHNSYAFLGQKLSEIMPIMPLRLFKIRDLR